MQERKPLPQIECTPKQVLRSFPEKQFLNRQMFFCKFSHQLKVISKKSKQDRSGSVLLIRCGTLRWLNNSSKKGLPHSALIQFPGQHVHRPWTSFRRWQPFQETKRYSKRLSGYQPFSRCL